MEQTRSPLTSLITVSLMAFASALLLLGPATRHSHAGPVTHVLYVLLLVLGFVALAFAGVLARRGR